MNDIKEICTKCGDKFLPLSSAKGEDAECCLRCITSGVIKSLSHWPVHKPSFNSGHTKNNKTKKAIFLFDYTGIMAKPWADAGYLCYCFDGQHKPGVKKDGNIIKVGTWFEPGNKLSHVSEIIELVNSADFVFGFPEYMDLKVTGVSYFDKKKNATPYFQIEATELCDLVRCLGVALECPWGFENPMDTISTQYVSDDFAFDPCDFGGYLPEGDQHPFYPEFYPGRDAYNKKTCISHSGDFVVPKPKRIEPAGEARLDWGDFVGSSLKKKNIVSSTPRGFANAVFEANAVLSN